MGKKKIAYQLTVDVPQALITSAIKSAEDYLMGEYELEISLKDHAGIATAIQKAIKQELDTSIDYIYTDDLVDSLNLEKMFKKQIAAAEKEMYARRDAEAKAAEEARRATSGLLRMNPDDIAEAMKLLNEAGIKVTR